MMMMIEHLYSALSITYIKMRCTMLYVEAIPTLEMITDRVRYAPVESTEHVVCLFAHGVFQKRLYFGSIISANSKEKTFS